MDINKNKDDNYLEMDDSDFDKLTNGFLYKTNKKDNTQNIKDLNEKEKEFIKNILNNEKEDLQLTKKEEAIMLINSLQKEMSKTDEKHNNLNNNKISSLME
jgi:hypothetical protein